jgi:hypothetical protein
MTALLMLQLATGLQWQAAHAAASPERQMSGIEAGHCPSSHYNTATKHDCCRSVGCQCHSAQSPAVPGSLRTSAAFSGLLLLPVFDTRTPVAHTNELFRPPIA